MFVDYTKFVSEAMYKIKQGTGLKKLTPKQILQRSSIALAQVKRGSNLESSLIEIRQSKLLILCINQKKLLKKVYNNILSSINL